MILTLIFGSLGILGGLLTCAADILLDSKGKDNVKKGKYGFIDSAWDHMDLRRFPASIFLALLGTPLLFLGFTAMAGQLLAARETFGKAFWYVAMVSCTSGSFIHTIICLLPVIYKTMTKKHSPEDAEEVLNAVYRAVAVPFWILYLLLTLGTSGMIIWAICFDYLRLSPAWILLTFPVLELTGLVLEKVRHDWFYDFPHILMPTLSLGLVGLLAILNTL